MDDLNLVVLISRWVHIMAAIITVGGAVFMRFALWPSATSVLDDEQHQRLRDAVRSRWAKFVHICIALLLVTGGLNFALLAMLPKIDAMPYHALFGVKLLMALAVFFLATALVGRSPGFAKMRKNSRKWLAVLAILGATIVLMSGMLNQVRTADGLVKVTKKI